MLVKQPYWINVINADTDILNARLNLSIHLGWLNASTTASCLATHSQVLAFCSHPWYQEPLPCYSGLLKKTKPSAPLWALKLSPMVWYLVIMDLKCKTHAKGRSQDWKLPRSKWAFLQSLQEQRRSKTQLLCCSPYSNHEMLPVAQLMRNRPLHF